MDYHALLSSYHTSGFQATNFGMAVEQITKMVLDIFCTLRLHSYFPSLPPSQKLETRGVPVPEEKKKPYLSEPGDRPVTNCTLFLGYTSNLMSSGIRETLRYLVQHNMVREVLC